jgi:hypothetical protein
VLRHADAAFLSVASDIVPAELDRPATGEDDWRAVDAGLVALHFAPAAREGGAALGDVACIDCPVESALGSCEVNT